MATTKKALDAAPHIRFIGTQDIYILTEDDWRGTLGVAAERGVPKRMVFWAGNTWTLPAHDGEDLLADEIMEYLEGDPQFVVVDKDDSIHIPFMRAKRRTAQYSALQLGRAAVDETDPIQAAKHLSQEAPITHIGPADVEGVTDTRDEAPPTGRIPGNEADAADATAAQTVGGGAATGTPSTTTTVGGSTRTSSTAKER
jgi:hypothetical protein